MGERITATTSKKEHWDAVTGATLRTLKGHSHWVDAVIFSPDGRLLASGSGISDKTPKGANTSKYIPFDARKAKFDVRRVTFDTGIFFREEKVT